MAHKLTTCTFCGVGCGMYLEAVGNQIVGAYPSMSHPTNEGRICVRGWHVHEVASSLDRLKSPLLKVDGQFREVSWDEAIGFIAGRMKEIRARHGPDALAFLNSPRCSNEEAYLLQKLARAVIGTNNVDHGTGVYCNNSINVLLDMLGVPATTSSISELAHSEVIVVDGVDLARQLPTIGGAVLRAKLAGAKLVVIDSRRHRVAESADFFLQLKPGTEPVLYGAMAKVLVDRGLMNLPLIKAHCRGYEEFLARVRDYDLLAAAESCGVAAEQIEAAALAYARARSAAILYSTGIEARDAAPVEAIVNLALLTGQLGKEGAGIFALTEHNNLQGVCDMGVLPDRLPGYRKIADDGARAEVEAVWGVQLPAKPGLASRSLLADRGKGQVRALWLCRYDPVSTAFFGDAANVLQQCELVVAQHLFLTESARYAHVVLPTTAFGEERVTFTNTERRIQLAEQVIEPLPGTSPAWQQLTQVARALGADWKYDSAADVMDEIGTVVPFYSGANYANLAAEYGRQWPCTKDRPLGTRSLFAEGLPAGGFKFMPITRDIQVTAPADYPLTLVFGHSLYYWNQNVLIQHSETLKREYRMLLLDYPEGFVEMNPDDAKQLGIRDGEKIRLHAAGGSAVTAARVTPEVRRGAVFVPYFVRQVQQQIRGTTENGVQLIPVRVVKEAG
ncbi:MAG: molybdopterin-dependent oxidoreductase [Verrucomicrobia bacterium]|nr:molybdopterin-dependent oxidoreductase [Verrucomicrobiota bacterium]